MRYLRVLTVLTLIGAVALTAALIMRGGRPALKPVRAATTLQSTLTGALKQYLPPLSPQLANPAPTTCPVASGGCSSNPCVIFVQSGSQPVALSVGGFQTGTLSKHIATAPTLSGGQSSQGCSRHALPRTLRVNSQIQRPALSAAISRTTR